jgi:hypothetical protein
MAILGTSLQGAFAPVAFPLVFPFPASALCNNVCA